MFNPHRFFRSYSLFQIMLARWAKISLIILALPVQLYGQSQPLATPQFVYPPQATQKANVCDKNSIINGVQFTGGAPPATTGAPLAGGGNESTCTSCHTNPGGMPGSVTITRPSSYNPGQVYTLTVEVSQSGRSEWGFELAAKKLSDFTQAGTLNITNPNTQYTNPSTQNGITYVTQTSGGTSIRTYLVQWVAPNPGVGKVRFYAAGLASNNAGGATGDDTYTTFAESDQASTISRTPPSMTFSATAGGSNPANQTLQISNVGGSTLNWSVSANQPWLSFSPGNGSSTGETDNVSVSVNIAGLAVGTYNATITISASGATNTPQTTAVTLTVGTPASFAVIATTLAHVSMSAAAWGDYDNDNDLDILLIGRDGSQNEIARVYRNDQGSFVDIIAGLRGVRDGSVAWGDYDNDGDLDILLSGDATQAGAARFAEIYRNDSGKFAPIAAGLSGTRNSSVAWGDYDNDGDLDVLLSGFSASSASSDSIVYRNDRGRFIRIAALPRVGSSAVAWGDYDNDGDLDILLTGLQSSGGSLLGLSKIFRNDNGNFVEIPTALAQVGSSAVAWGDYDNDGDLDILLAGIDRNSTRLAKIYRNENGSFVDINASLVGFERGSVAWGDYDNDGDLDILLNGEDNSNTPISKIYRNTGGNFTDINAGLSDVRLGSSVWGDYDNDGALDILLTGLTKSGAALTEIYRNLVGTKNTAPSAPANLIATVAGNTVTFSWNKSTDGQTAQNALTYNLRVGTKPGGSEIVAPMANVSTGYRRVIRLGNTNHRNSWTIKNLSNGTYFWSVQALDHAFAGSAFAAEQSFSIVAMNPVPTLSSLVPASGNRLQTLDVVFTGTNFINGVTTVNVGSDITVNSTIITSATTLTANLTISANAATGPRNFSVTNSGPGGGTSTAQTFTVNNPAPTLSSLVPASGNRLQTLDVVFTGTKFISGVTTVNAGSDITVNSTTVTSTMTLTANLTISANAATGPRNFSVTNSGPGGGTSAAQTFTVNNPAPTLTNLAPNSGNVGQTLNVVFTGTNFISGVTTVNAGAGITVNSTMVTSAASLTANLSIGANAATGPRNFSVINSGPGGGTSGPQIFTVTAVQTDRVVRAVNTTASPGGTVNVSVELVAQGDENALGFSLNFDASILSNPQARLGKDAATASLNINSSQQNQGRLGIVLSLSSGQKFSAGTREIVVVNFAITSNTAAISTPIDFGDQPVAREVSDSNANSLPVNWTPGTITFTRGFEADVSPRPTGNNNGTVTIADWVQAGRFAAGLEIPRTDVNEFQRADCAPRSCGDGRVTVSDWVQAGLYAAALEPVVAACGPLSSNNESSPVLAANGSTRAIRAMNTSFARGRLDTLAVEFEAQGDENAAGFGLTFDENLLILDRVALGSGATGATLHVNSNQKGSGRVGIAMALPAGQAFAAGARQLVLVIFSVLPNAAASSTLIEFSDQSIAREVVNTAALPVAAAWTPATITLQNVTGVKSTAAEGPLVFELGQNYPNPFNPSTQIKFSVPGSGRVTLKVYTLLGKEAATLVNGEFSAGRYEVEWNASGMQSGVYFYRLSSGAEVRTMKLVLMQ